jgi:histidinol dehydrogenase
MKIVASTSRVAVRALLSVTRSRDAAVERRVRRIIADVRRHGDRAVKRYAKDLDGLTGRLEVPREAWDRAARTIATDVRRALRRAARHILHVSRAQRPRQFRTTVSPGVVVQQRVIPLDRVGCYVPGGRYPLPSSLLMTAIPARVAGVAEVIVACPRPDAVVLTAAIEAGVDRLFQVGGAHAIAALAWGTETVPRVDKIVGPGNQWVSAAKALVSADCAIDFYAGPTEIVIVAARGPAEWIAADLVAQAEHDPEARAVLITPNRALAKQVVGHVERLLTNADSARPSLARHGGVIVTRTMDEAMALANDAAPEHLVVDRESLVSQVRSAGAVFVGSWTAQVAGDYAIGSNHVLPTAGAARFRGGLNTADFVRLVSVQRVSRRGLQALAPTVRALARAEGLDAHDRSIAIRVSTT